MYSQVPSIAFCMSSTHSCVLCVNQSIHLTEMTAVRTPTLFPYTNTVKPQVSSAERGRAPGRRRGTLSSSSPCSWRADALQMQLCFIARRHRSGLVYCTSGSALGIGVDRRLCRLLSWGWESSFTWLPTRSRCSPNRKSFSMSCITIICCEQTDKTFYSESSK